MDRSWYTCYGGKCIFECLSIDWRILLPESGTNNGRCSYLGTAFKWGMALYVGLFPEKLRLSNGIPKRVQKGYIDCAQEHGSLAGGNCTYDDGEVILR